MYPKLFVNRNIINDLEIAGKRNHMSISSMLALLAHALKKGSLTVYNGEIVTHKTIYDTPTGQVIR